VLGAVAERDQQRHGPVFGVAALDPCGQRRRVSGQHRITVATKPFGGAIPVGEVDEDRDRRDDDGVLAHRMLTGR
jgi:hypothetical protein